MYRWVTTKTPNFKIFNIWCLVYATESHLYTTASPQVPGPGQGVTIPWSRRRTLRENCSRCHQVISNHDINAQCNIYSYLRWRSRPGRGDSLHDGMMLALDLYFVIIFDIIYFLSCNKNKQYVPVLGSCLVSSAPLANRVCHWSMFSKRLHFSSSFFLLLHCDYINWY